MVNRKFLVALICSWFFESTLATAATWDGPSLCQAGNKYARPSSEKLNRRLAEAIDRRDHDESLYLLEGGAKLSKSIKKDDFFKQIINEFLLLEAAKNNDLESLKTALGNGANPNVIRPVDSMWTPLMIASFCGYENIAAYLIEHGANTHDSQALYLAVMSEHLKIAKQLLEKGASPNPVLGPNKVPGAGSLMAAKSKEAACLLLRFGANPNAIGPEGEFPLGSAIDNPEVFKVLLGAGADVTLKMNDGLTILDHVSQISNPEVKKILLNHKQYENKADCRARN